MNQKITESWPKNSRHKWSAMLHEVAAIVQARPPCGRLDSFQSAAHSGDNQSQTSNCSANRLTLCLFVFLFAARPDVRIGIESPPLDAAGRPVPRGGAN